MTPAWMNSVLVYAALLPEEAAADLALATKYIIERGGRPPGAYEFMKLNDPRWPQAVRAVAAGMRDREVNHRVLDWAQGLFLIEMGKPSQGRPALRILERAERRVLRIMFLRGAASPGQ